MEFYGTGIVMVLEPPSEQKFCYSTVRTVQNWVWVEKFSLGTGAETEKSPIVCLTSGAQRVRYKPIIVTVKKSRLERETTQVTINSTLLGQRTNFSQEPTERKKIQAENKAQPCPVVQLSMHR